MAKNQKKTNQVLVIGAIGLGAYALYKTVIDPDVPYGSGSIGGSDSLYDELPQHEKSWVAEIFDPNTIPEQPIQETPIPQDDSPVSPYIPTPKYDPTPPFSYVGSPTQTDPQPTPIFNEGGFLGTGVTAPQWGLGLLGLTSTPFMKLPKYLDGSTDFMTAWRRAGREALEETPVAGKRLGDFAFDTTKKGTKAGTEVAGNWFKRGTSGAGSDVIQAKVKTGAKRTGQYGSRLIPFVGIVAGAEFDRWVDDRPRWLAYPTNIAGDLVGGALGVATSPLAVTGVGATVPVGLSIAGQVGTEMAIYGAYDTITGNKLTPEQQRELFIQTKQMTNQGTIVDDEFWGQQWDSITSPSNVGGSFNLAGSSKNISYGNTTLNQSKGTSTPFTSNVSPIFSSQSVFSSQVNTARSTGGSSKPVSSPINTGSATNKSSTPINTSRFVAQAGGGYSDTVAMQSVSREVAQQRSTASNVFTVSSSSSSSRRSTPSSTSARSGATTTTSQAMTPARTSPASSTPARTSPASSTPARTSPTPVQAVRSTASAVTSRVTSTASAVTSRVSTTASNVRSTASAVTSRVSSWLRR